MYFLENCQGILVKTLIMRKCYKLRSNMYAVSRTLGVIFDYKAIYFQMKVYICKYIFLSQGSVLPL